jgi:WD repeat-containing protein 1 (actin-interacting protein 1)
VFTWDTGNTAGECVGHSKRVSTCAYKPSRPFRVFTGSEDMKTIFYAGPPFKFDHSNSSHTNFVNCLRYSPNGEKVASVSSDKKIQFYDGKTGQEEGSIPDAHTGSIYCVAFSPDSTKIVTTSADKTVKYWDVASLTCEQTFTPGDPADLQVGDMQLGVVYEQAPGSLFITLSLNGNLNYFDPSTGSATPVRVVQGHQVAITALTADRENGIVYTGSFDGVVCATNFAQGGIVTRLVGTDKRNTSGAAHGGMVSGLTVIGGTLLSIGWDDALRRADLSTNTYLSESPTNGQPTGISSSGDLVAYVTNAEISIYRGEELIASLTNLSYQPQCVSLFGAIELAVGGSDNKTHIYSLGENSTLTEITAIETRSKVTAVAYNPLGDSLAIGDEGRQVELYDRNTWEPRVKGRWVFHTSRINCLAWSPSGTQLASGSLDENIFIWDAVNPANKLHLPFCHMSGVTGVAWLDEERLVSAGNDHVIVSWKLPAPSS